MLLHAGRCGWLRIAAHAAELRAAAEQLKHAEAPFTSTGQGWAGCATCGNLQQHMYDQARKAIPSGHHSHYMQCHLAPEGLSLACSATVLHMQHHDTMLLSLPTNPGLLMGLCSTVTRATC